jgi:autotransporter-associated beta strand protein
VATGTAVIDCDISGGGLIKIGNGTLLLGGTDSYASTTILAGVLQLQTGTALPEHTELTINGGVLELGGTTATLATVTLASGSIAGGTLDVGTGLELYSGTVLADIDGPTMLDKLGPGTNGTVMFTVGAQFGL